MSGAVIASPSTYLSITLINRNSARLEARQGHGLLGKSLFRHHQSLTLPDLKFALLNPLHRDVVFALSLFAWPVKVGEAKPSALSDSSFRNPRKEGPSPPATPPDFRQTLWHGTGRQTSGAIYMARNVSEQRQQASPFPPTIPQSLLWSLHCLHTCPLRQACITFSV